MQVVTLVRAVNAKLNDNLVFPFCFQAKKMESIRWAEIVIYCFWQQVLAVAIGLQFSHLCFVATSYDHISIAV